MGPLDTVMTAFASSGETPVANAAAVSLHIGELIGLDFGRRSCEGTLDARGMQFFAVGHGRIGLLQFVQQLVPGIKAKKSRDSTWGIGYLTYVRRYWGAAEVHLRYVRRYFSLSRVSDGTEPPFSASDTRDTKELAPHISQIDLFKDELTPHITQLHACSGKLFTLQREKSKMCRMLADKAAQ